MAKNSKAKTQKSFSKAIYNPLVLIIVSVIFTPILGALFQAKNWDVFGEYDRARESRFWVRCALWLLALFIVAQALFANEPIMPLLTPYFLLVLWLAWFITSGIKQLKYIKTIDMTQYEKAPIGRVFTLGLGGYVIYAMVALSLGLAFDMFGLTQPATHDKIVTISVPEGASKPVVTEKEVLPSQNANQAP